MDHTIVCAFAESGSDLQISGSRLSGEAVCTEYYYRTWPTPDRGVEALE